MRLWVKISLIAIIICTAAMGICATVILNYTASNEVDKAVQAGLSEHYLFCTSLASSVNSESEEGLSEITNRSIVQYYFKNVAGFYENMNTYFSMTQGGKYLYNRAAQAPLALLDEPEGGARKYAIMEINGTKILIIVGQQELLDQTFNVYYSQDITHIYQEMQELTWQVTWILCFSIVALSLLLLLLIRLALRPVRNLSKASVRMAAGVFSERVPIVSNDEVGLLSRSFNQMAEAVETHINQIEQTSHQRNLLLSSLTHELKTPMTAIIGYADSIMHFKMNTDQHQRAVWHIYEHCRRMERLSQKLMNLISLDAGEQIEMIPVAVDKLFQQVCDAVESTLREKKQTIEKESSLKFLIADNDLLFSLLVNLIDNASKASITGAAIRLRAYKTDSGCPVLQVQDTGIGIPEAEIANVTEPFYRVDKSRNPKNGGIGLGLSLCKMIAQKHDATLLIESCEGKGTSVKVVFPTQAKE